MNLESKMTHSDNQSTCRCVPADMELATAWNAGPGSIFRYRLGLPGKRLPSGWFTAEGGESAPASFVERSIYHFLKALVADGKIIRVSPGKIRSIRLLARFEALPAEDAKEGAR